MPPSRLLQRRPRPSGSGSGVSSDVNASPNRHHNVPVLPPYEPPVHTLNDTARRSLKDLATNRETRKYASQLDKSFTNLRDAVSLINDTLSSRKQALAKMATKREAKGSGKDEIEIAVEEDVARLETQAAELSKQTEASIRTLIDYKAELEDESNVLDSVLRTASQQQPRRKQKQPRTAAAEGAGDDDNEAEEQEDEEMEDIDDQTPIVGLNHILQEERQRYEQAYNRLTVQQKYAKNNEYIGFKRTWHDALHQDDHIPLPDPSTWFDEDGNPVIDAPPRDDDDDDLVVEREIIDLKCPLSLQVLKEPYSNHRCKHTFEKSAILDYLRTNRGSAGCPVCSVGLQVSDLYLDELMLRKVKRAQEAERRAEQEEEDDDVDMDGDDSVIAGASRNIKKERRRAMEDLDEDSDN